MLGVPDTNLKDACAELGCGAFQGGIVPLLTPDGALSTESKETDSRLAACAVVRIQRPLDKLDEHSFEMSSFFSDVMTRFESSSVSARIFWSTDDLDSLIQAVERWTSELMPSQVPRVVHRSASWPNTLDGEGISVIEATWPAPAMSLETRSWLVWLFVGSFGATVLLVVVLSTSAVLRWQGIPAIALLAGGQVLMTLSQVVSLLTVRSQRESRYCDVSYHDCPRFWTLVDNRWHPSRVVYRPLSPSFLSPSSVTLGQHCKMKSRQYVPTWQALAVLLLVVVGFAAFYVGGKSANIRTVSIYLVGESSLVWEN